jgi:maltose alpha-D-glucosyltransferase/alpha-amylase
MQWSGDRNAGFSRANPQSLYLPVIIDPEYHAQAVNVEAQQNNSSSLFWWTKRLVALRRRYRAFGRGKLEFLYPENRKVLAFTRTFEGSEGAEVILVVANLSRFMQCAELDLTAYQGLVPVELFGQAQLPRIGEHPYLLTLGPHSFYWFALEAQPARERRPREGPIPVIEVDGSWEDLFGRRARASLEEALPAFLMGRRWFGAKALKIASATIEEAVSVPRPGAGRTSSRAPDQTAGILTLVRVEFVEGDAQTYVLPFGAAPAQRASDEQRRVFDTAVARLRTKDGEWMLYDALWDKAFDAALLEAIGRRRQFAGSGGRLLATPTKAFKAVTGSDPAALEPNPMQAEQSNTSVLFGDRLFFKLFRRPEEGINPDLEIGRFLTERAGYPHVPAVAGALEYRRGRSEPMTIGILQKLVPNSGDAWHYTLDSLGRFFEEAMMRRPEVSDPPAPEGVGVFEAASQQPPQLARDTMADYLERASLLGIRTAELHLALASDPTDPAFAPEPITSFYQRSLYQTMRSITVQNFRLLRTLQEDAPEVVQVLDLENDVIKRLQRVLNPKISATRIRVHGDYHLGQVLYTGKDFVIIDFEGEPARPLSERRIKRSPLQDVAGMLRSLNYAAYSAMYGRSGPLGPDHDPSALQHWVRFWYLWAGGTFLGSYLRVADGASFLPKSQEDTRLLLDTFLVGKALYELGYEANNRPEWIKIPIQGLLHLLEES